MAKEKYPHLSIQMEVDANEYTPIEDVFFEAIALATRIKCPVRFEFNDVKCTAYPYGEIKQGLIEYDEVVNSEVKNKVANARRAASQLRRR